MTLTADPIRLRQAVGNLVANAIRHSPSGGRVTLSARTAGDLIAIDVADTGPGIPAEQQAPIFERFWRAENRHPPSPAPAQPGTRPALHQEQGAPVR
jgi:two-component system sensor histidine kinase BaeS